MLRGTRHSGGAAANLGVCVLAGCALIAAATWASGDSSPRREYRGTHVGVPVADLVVLKSAGTGGNLKFYRAGADGTIAAAEFAVPAGMRLVVTETECQAATSSEHLLRIFIENKATPTTRTLVSVAATEANYGIGTRSSFTTGFSVSSAGRLVADFSNFITEAFPDSNINTSGVVLRGYLVADA